MPDLNLQFLQTLPNEKQIVFKCFTTLQLYAQTNFPGQLIMKMTVNKKSDHFSSYSSGFRKVLVQSDVELPRQAQNDKVERFRHYM